MHFHSFQRNITFSQLIVQFLLILHVNKCISLHSSSSASTTAFNSDSIIANTTEAFFVALRTTEYFPSEFEVNSSSTASSNNGQSMNNNEPSPPVELLMSVAGRADLPEWMYYKFDRQSKTGYLYGSPVTDGEIDLEIIALNTRTYDTTMDTMKLTIVERESEYYYFNIKYFLPLPLHLQLLKVHFTLSFYFYCSSLASSRSLCSFSCVTVTGRFSFAISSSPVTFNIYRSDVFSSHFVSS